MLLHWSLSMRDPGPPCRRQRRGRPFASVPNQLPHGFQQDVWVAYGGLYMAYCMDGDSDLVVMRS